MTEQKNYLSVLMDSLQKKLQVLDEVIQKNQEQTELMQAERLDTEALDTNMDQKTVLIQRLNELDDGFEAVYERVKPELLQHQAQYADEIHVLQDLISRITDKSVSIQAAEARNKQLAERQFRFARQDIQQARTTTRAASDYYKAMGRNRIVSPQMLDEKK
ncbi:MAG: flagellar export chaperone FlgN [Lachnospiraceae bacterium]